MCCWYYQRWQGLSIIQLVEGMQGVSLRWVADLDENTPVFYVHGRWG